MKKLVIPIGLCLFVIQNRLEAPFRLYIHLMKTSSGMKKLSSQDMELIARQLDYKSIRSVRNNLKRLLMLNWIGYDRRSQFYFIRSFDKLIHDLKIGHHGAIYFTNQNLDAFIAAVAITHCENIIRFLKKKRSTGKRPLAPGNKGSALQEVVPMSIRYMAKVLKISPKKVHKLKALAGDHDFIKVINGSEDTGISSQFYREYIQAYPDDHVSAVNGHLMVKKSDQIHSMIQIKKRRKKKMQIFNKGL